MVNEEEAKGEGRVTNASDRSDGDNYRHKLEREGGDERRVNIDAD